MSKKNEPIPPIANAINADLIPRVKKWLAKHYPEVKFTDSNLSTLMVYATAPDDFKMPTATDAVRACAGGKRLDADDALKLLPDQGLILIHKLMMRHSKATVATLAQFQHQYDLLLNDKLRRAIRRENLEGRSANGLVKHLIDTKQILPSQFDSARRKIQTMRGEDLSNIELKEIANYSTKYQRNKG